MFAAGLVEETRALLERYRNRGNLPMVLNSLGYRQAAQYLAGELTLDEAIAAAQQGHRNYAKRQMTWFRRDPTFAGSRASETIRSFNNRAWSESPPSRKADPSLVKQPIMPA